MKNLMLSLILLAGFFSVNGQTATNFNCNDCSSVNHDLFTELDAGKVVVICWVMPCTTCLSGALAAQSACQSFSSSNPGEVYYYCVDDLANTTCSTLSSWCSSNGVTSTTAKFSNSSISMTDYGTSGMPKVVVLGGGSTHTVYYNENNSSITTAGIQTAISNALAASIGIDEVSVDNFQLSIFPNPITNKKATISYELKSSENVTIEIYDCVGANVSLVSNENQDAGKHQKELDLSSLSAGIYFIKLNSDNKNDLLKFVVSE